MKKIIIGICCILCVCSCTNTKDNSDTPLNTEYLEQEITLNLDKIMELPIKLLLTPMTIHKMNIMIILLN